MITYNLNASQPKIQPSKLGKYLDLELKKRNVPKGFGIIGFYRDYRGENVENFQTFC